MEIDAAGSRPGFRQKKVESVSKARRKHALTCRKPGCKPGRKPGLQPGLQLARIIDVALWVSASFQIFALIAGGDCPRWGRKLSRWGECPGEYVREGMSYIRRSSYWLRMYRYRCSTTDTVNS